MTTPPASALVGTVKVRLALPPADPMEADQWSNFQPLSGTAVTVEQVPPFLTSWLVEPLIEPPPAETNSTGTLAPRTAIGSEEISHSGTPVRLGDGAQRLRAAVLGLVGVGAHILKVGGHGRFAQVDAGRTGV